MGDAKIGLLVVISGPSGAGKGSVRKALKSYKPDVVYGVSCTTRDPRPGEVCGKHYHFVSHAEFQRLRESGELVEWAEVYGNHYGTPREPMESQLRAGTDVIVEKDPQGAMALRERYPEAVYVFVLPPSMQELRNRIRNRGTESESALANRLHSAGHELGYVRRYDYLIVNDEVEEAGRLLAAIIDAEKCRVSRQEQLLSHVVED